MDSNAPSTLADQLAASLDWWREAGVDQDYSDEITKLLAEGEVEPAKPPPKKAEAPQEKQAPAPPQIGGDNAQFPQSFAGFAPWWVSEPSLDNGNMSKRLAPRGVQNAKLMVIVPMPEEADSDQLLSGNQGKLVSNMLRAMQIAPEASYQAAVLPRHMPFANWSELQQAGLGKVLHHHIQLAAPERILVLGSDILPLLGLEKRRGVLEIESNGSAIQLLASYAPENLLENARLRADLWRRWLDWTGKA